MRLIPRDERFFEMFAQLAQRITGSAKLLHQLFTHPERLAEFEAKIKDVEHEADDLVHQVNKRIDTSFVTPLDREDIHLLANRLDNVVDLIDGTARRARMFRITETREAALRLSDVLVRAGGCIEEAVRRHQAPARRSPSYGRKIKALEEEGDAHLPRGRRRALRRHAEHARRHQVEGAVRQARGRDGRVRGRVERAGEHLAQEQLGSPAVVTYVLAIVFVAFIFDFINGFHDSANSIATIVGTRVLSPARGCRVGRRVQLLGAVLRRGRPSRRPSRPGSSTLQIVEPNLIFAALLGAIVWNLITWYYGIPSSSSHALIGGLAGAALAKAGLDGDHLREQVDRRR